MRQSAVRLGCGRNPALVLQWEQRGHTPESHSSETGLKHVPFRREYRTGCATLRPWFGLRAPRGARRPHTRAPRARRRQPAPPGCARGSAGHTSGFGETIEEQTAEHVQFPGLIEEMGFPIGAGGNHVGPLLCQPMRRTVRPIIHEDLLARQKSGVKPPQSKLSSSLPGSGQRLRRTNPGCPPRRSAMRPNASLRGSR